jgi:hypothetical protein
MVDGKITSGRAFERFINFSDGVTAVAITLLALPLVNIAAPQGAETIWDVITRNSGAISAFAITFAVVGTMWKSHARVFQSIQGYDQPMFLLNLAWLALIVLLPWPASLYGTSSNSVHQSGDPLAGAGLFYWLVLAAISFLLSAMSIHASRTPGLREDSEMRARPGGSVRGAAVRGLVFTVACVAIGLSSLFSPVAAQWLPLILVPIAIFTGRYQRKQIRST